VTKLEVGLKVPSLRSDEIANCLVKATTSTLMIEKAKRVGQLIRSESGVDNAVAAIQYNIVRAVSDRKTMTYQ
jgi:sterol 3beta-glucosyltransferase